MTKSARIAIREAATLLDKEATDQISGGMIQTGYNTPDGCFLDHSTDCWVTGGDFISNDDAQDGR